MRIRTGRQIVEKVILLDAPWQHVAGAAAGALPAMPLITSAAPLPATRATHEYQQEAAREGTKRHDVSLGPGAELMVMCRSFEETGPTVLPWEGVTVLDARGNLVADLATTGDRRTTGDPVGVCAFELPPGAYLLTYPAGDGVFATQSLILPPGGWRVEAYLLHTGGNGRPARPRRSLLMRRVGMAWGTGEDVLLEKARVALADERLVLNDELSALLLLKFDNPLAGIIGGHLLVIDQEQGGDAKPEMLNTVVDNLRRLVGSDHPDVEALSLACPDAGLRTQRPLGAAPMFERSWRLFVAASQENPTLVPISVWQQVHAGLLAPPFLSWSTDRAIQQHFRKALAEAAFARNDRRDPLPPPVPAPLKQAAAAFAPMANFAANIATAAAPKAVAETAKAIGFVSDAVGQAASAAASSIVGAWNSASVSVGRAAVVSLPPIALEALKAEFLRDR
jgi:hypothetical protein